MLHFHKTKFTSGFQVMQLFRHAILIWFTHLVEQVFFADFQKWGRPLENWNLCSVIGPFSSSFYAALYSNQPPLRSELLYPRYILIHHSSLFSSPLLSACCWLLYNAEVYRVFRWSVAWTSAIEHEQWNQMSVKQWSSIEQCQLNKCKLVNSNCILD